MFQSSVHSPAKGALHRTSVVVVWVHLKTWEVALEDRLTCPGFAASSQAKQIIGKEKFSRKLPLRSSSLSTSLIALLANLLENITSGRVTTTSV
jgi:hypothetical protein